jgi:predicted dehydrogenase
MGIIGAGNWGRQLVRVFGQLSDLVICSTRSSHKNVEYLKRRYPRLEVSFDYRSILEREEIEAVAIATPIDTHFQLAREALLHGKKVFVEKPLAGSLEEARQLIELARNKVLFVGHIFLYSSCYGCIKEIIKADPPVQLSFSWLKYGSFNEDLVLNLLSHELAILYGLTGRLPRAIKASNLRPVITGLDLIDLELYFHDPLPCRISVNRVHPHKSKQLQIITSRGEVYYWIDDRLLRLDKKRHRFELLHVEEEEPLTAEAAAFLDCVAENIEPAANKEIALKTMVMLEEVQRAVSEFGENA